MDDQTQIAQRMLDELRHTSGLLAKFLAVYAACEDFKVRQAVGTPPDFRPVLDALEGAVFAAKASVERARRMP